MDIKEMEVSALIERRNAIKEELELPEADLNALEEEVRSINEEIERRKAEAEKKEEIRKAVADGEGIVINEMKEERKMADIEVRNTVAYVDAFANYIKTGKADECRKLLTENGTDGTVPIPEFVEQVVKTAWDKEGIMRRVKKAYLAGNLKVGFEISSTGAVVHAEGDNAVNEETLTLGIVTLVPANVKKWISLSDEVLDLRGEAFLRYVYEELAYQIAKKSADEMIAKIEACTTTGSSTSPIVPAITSTQIAVDLVAQALGQLSDEASAPVIMMNKATWAEFKKAQYANKFSVDPFEGLAVEFNNTIKSFASASTGDTYVIVGDLGYGAMANLPNGEEIKFNFDDKTLATQDLVRVIGREYIGMGVVAPKAFCKIQK